MADYLASKPFSAELVVVDDGSTDGTFAAVKQIAVELPVLVVASHYEHNRGKGLAFKARKRVVYRGESSISWVSPVMNC